MNDNNDDDTSQPLISLIDDDTDDSNLPDNDQIEIDGETVTRSYSGDSDDKVVK